MNTKTISNRPKRQVKNIDEFMEIAKNFGYHKDYTAIASKFMYDLDSIKCLKLWEHKDVESANKMAKDLKSFYKLAENVSNQELINEIERRFNLYKIENPDYYKMSEFSKAFAKRMSEI